MMQEQQIRQFQQGILHHSLQMTKAAAWKLDMQKQQIKNTTYSLLEKNQLILQNALQTNHALSLTAAQNRGFVWLSKADKAIPSATALEAGDEIIAHFKDGEKKLKVSKQ